MVYYQKSIFIFGFPLSNKLFLKRSISASAINKPLLSGIKSFKNTFFLYCINEWNNLTVQIRNSKSVSALKKLIKCKKKETQYLQSMIHWLLNSLPTLDFNFVI